MQKNISIRIHYRRSNLHLQSHANLCNPIREMSGENGTIKCYWPRLRLSWNNNDDLSHMELVHIAMRNSCSIAVVGRWLLQFNEEKGHSIRDWEARCGLKTLLRRRGRSRKRKKLGWCALINTPVINIRPVRSVVPLPRCGISRAQKWLFVLPDSPRLVFVIGQIIIHSRFPAATNRAPS